MRTLFARIRKPSLRQGLIFGTIVGFLEIIYNYASTKIVELGPATTLIVLALFIIFAFIAGRRAAQETGKLGSGMAAGLLTGLIGSVLSGLGSLIYALIYLQEYVNFNKTHPSAGVSPSTYTPGLVLAGFAILVLFDIILALLVTLMSGMAGGFFGRGRALASTPGGVYEESQFEPAQSEVPQHEVSQPD
jgi:hypothetical protein